MRKRDRDGNAALLAVRPHQGAADAVTAALNLFGCEKVTDAGVAHFRACKALDTLDLRAILITDMGLANFQDCKNLLNVELAGTKVSDAGLEIFKGSKKLQGLALADMKISDLALEHLKNCENLWYLSIQNTQVTDAGLGHLTGCKNLKGLNLQKTKVSAVGVEKLKAALPKCKIEWDGGVIEPRVGLDVERKAIPIGASAFDKLDPNSIPKAERDDWQPKEPVAVIGTHARRHAG
jgi:hypothetical protein